MRFIRRTVVAGERLTHEEQQENGRYRLTLGNPGERPVELTEVSAVFRFDFTPEDRYFLNGYQSWTYSPERSRGQFDTAMRWCPKKLDESYGFSNYSDAAFSDPLPLSELRRGCKRGWTYAYVRRGEHYCLFASLCEDSGFTRLRLDPGEGLVFFEKDCRGRMLQPGERWQALDAAFYEGGEDAVFDAWFADLGVRALPAAPKLGYTSWYNCYQNISAQQILRDLAGMDSLPVRPEIFQIDDGFERFVGDWLDVDEAKFPEGLAPIAARIREAGYEAGLWLAPFVCERNSRLAAEHPEWLLRREGKPVFTGANWSGGLALDPYHPGLRAWLREVFDHYKALGFTLFKLDFLYAACMFPRPDKTRGEIMAECMDFLRELAGEAAILGCGVPLASAFGRVEYCRIGPDMTLDFNDRLYMRGFHNERPSTLHTQRNTLFRRQLDGRAFRNDPDVFLLRKENNRLSEHRKYTLAVVNALFGSLLFASDDFGAYDEKQRRLFAALAGLQKATLTKVELLPPERRVQPVIVSYALDGVTRRLRLEL